MQTNYLESVIKQFEYYKMLGEKTFAQIPGEKLFWQYNDESNSIATIVKYLWGNMLSRWTDIGILPLPHRANCFYREDVCAKLEFIINPKG